MLVSTTTELLEKRFGREKTIRLIAEAGFDAYDISLCSMAGGEDEFCSENWRERAQYYRELADGLGIVCNQSHAPFPSSFLEDDKTEERFALVVRSMEVSAIMGAKTVVVHPIQHLPYISNVEELKERNKVFYRRLMPFAEKFGITVVTENMWHVMKMWVDGTWEEPDPGKNPIVDSTCASGEEFAAYIDAVENDHMGACLDLGHAMLVRRDPAELVRALGPRLKALHVHDVDGLDDLHTAPYVSVGIVDFDAVTTALAEVNYTGDMTFEALRFFLRVPDALIPAALKYLCEIGKYLAAEVARKKA